MFKELGGPQRKVARPSPKLVQKVCNSLQQNINDGDSTGKAQNVIEEVKSENTLKSVIVTAAPKVIAPNVVVKDSSETINKVGGKRKFDSSLVETAAPIESIQTPPTQVKQQPSTMVSAIATPVEEDRKLATPKRKMTSLEMLASQCTMADRSKDSASETAKRPPTPTSPPIEPVQKQAAPAIVKANVRKEVDDREDREQVKRRRQSVDETKPSSVHQAAGRSNRNKAKRPSQRRGWERKPGTFLLYKSQFPSYRNTRRSPYQVRNQRPGYVEATWEQPKTDDAELPGVQTWKSEVVPDQFVRIPAPNRIQLDIAHNPLDDPKLTGKEIYEMGPEKQLAYYVRQTRLRRAEIEHGESCEKMIARAEVFDWIQSRLIPYVNELVSENIDSSYREIAQIYMNVYHKFYDPMEWEGIQVTIDTSVRPLGPPVPIPITKKQSLQKIIRENLMSKEYHRGPLFNPPSHLKHEDKPNSESDVAAAKDKDEQKKRAGGALRLYPKTKQNRSSPYSKKQKKAAHAKADLDLAALIGGLCIEKQ